MSPPDPQTRPGPAYDLGFRPVKIHAAEATTPPAAVRPDPARDAWLGTAGGERRNGRQPFPLTPGHWKVAATSELAVGMRPGNVVVIGDRVLVQGGLVWQLFGGDGHALAQAPISGGVTVDPERACFYAADPTGPLHAWKLADGSLAWILEPFFGATYERAHVTRRDDRLLVASIERPSDPHGVQKPSLTALEVQRVPAKPEVNRFGFLERTERLAELMLNSASVKVASGDQGLVVAGPDTLYLPDEDLRIRAALSGDFDPLALSLDERDGIHLIGRHGARTFLWRVERDGRRLWECALDTIEPGAAEPPAIGFDHRTWVFAGERWTVVSPAGRVLATNRESEAIRGLSVTADGWALVTVGRTVVALRPVEKPGTPAFERHVLFTSPGGPLVTPAILTASGQMWVASAKQLFRLEASLQ